MGGGGCGRGRRREEDCGWVGEVGGEGGGRSGERKREKERMRLAPPVSSVSLQEAKTIRKTIKPSGDPSREWHRPFHRGSNGLHPGARHSPPRESGGRFTFGIVSWTMVRRVGVFQLSATKRRPSTQQKVRKPPPAAPTISFLSSRSLSRKPLSDTTPPGEPLCQTRKSKKPR